MRMSLRSGKERVKAWEPPPLDWRKFDDPCVPQTKAEKREKRRYRMRRTKPKN